MNDGYVVLVSNAKPTKAIFSYEGSNLSKLGLAVLNEFENGLIIEKFNNIEPINFEEKYIENLSMCLFEIDFIKQKSVLVKMEDYRRSTQNSSKIFRKYVYEYDSDNQILNVYFEGDLLFEIKKYQVGLFRYIFENELSLKAALSYNPKNLCNDRQKNYIKELKRLIKSQSSVEEIKNILKKAPIIFINKDKYEIKGNRLSYIRQVCNDKGMLIEFLIQEHYRTKNFDLFLIKLLHKTQYVL